MTDNLINPNSGEVNESGSSFSDDDGGGFFQFITKEQ